MARAERLIDACLARRLPELDLSGLDLLGVPDRVASLTWLLALNLSDNLLAELPPEIGELTHVIELRATGNQLRGLPPELARLTGLRTLDLADNDLAELPDVVLELTSLTELGLGTNRLETLPTGLGRLEQLRILDLDDTWLGVVPDCVAELRNLRRLGLSQVGLREVPAFVGGLEHLEHLDLSGNQLRSLPHALAELRMMESITVTGNPLVFPPPEVVNAGTQAVLAFLDHARDSSVRQWSSKVVVVGEGRVGKTSLLRALRGEEHDPLEETTHGLAVDRLRLRHPDSPTDREVVMQLATWDFGGQEIYHATHQFFLTDRSLFLLLWDAQAGWEAGKLHYWLDMIKARAPLAPVVLVATHLGPRPPDLPLSELRETYRDVIVASLAADSASGEGIAEVRECIRVQAAGLPLMGALWPRSWLAAADAVRAMPARYVEPEELRAVLAARGITEEQQQDSLTAALHSLGDLLYYSEDEELRDLVVLRPQWLTTYISRVLDSHRVLGDQGVFRHSYGDELWCDVERLVRKHFIPMMERFDLSYRTDDGAGSLVVELLPWEPPAYQQRWEAAGEQRELRLRYRLHTVPPGIPTWFLARSHRFSTGLHWRSGALLAHPDGAHLGLVTVDRHAKTAELRVRGPYPNDFFAVLKDGFEQTLARYPGLEVTRAVPCPHVDGEGRECRHEFQYEQLVARLTRRPAREYTECPEHLDDLSVRTLLQGVAPPELVQTTRLVEQARAEVAQLRVEVVGAGEAAERSRAQLAAMLAEQQRGFLAAQRAGQSRQEVLCPGVVSVERVSRRRFGGLLSRDCLLVHLWCEAPGEWHRLAGVEPYELPTLSERTAMLVSYAEKVTAVLKYAVPVAGAGLGVFSEDLGRLVRDEMDLAKALVEQLPEGFSDGPATSLTQSLLLASRHSEYRALQTVLTELDPAQRWGGLDKVTTPEGHTYWLCERHARAFRPAGSLPPGPRPELLGLPTPPGTAPGTPG